MTDHAFDNSSYDAFENGYFLSRDMMKWLWNAYISDATDAGERNQHYASPLRASLDELRACRPR